MDPEHRQRVLVRSLSATTSICLNFNFALLFILKEYKVKDALNTNTYHIAFPNSWEEVCMEILLPVGWRTSV